MRTVYEIELPISADQADVIGMPAEFFERAVRQLGNVVRLRDVLLEIVERNPEDFAEPYSAPQRRKG